MQETATILLRLVFYIKFQQMAVLIDDKLKKSKAKTMVKAITTYP